QYVRRDDQVQTFRREFAKQRDRLGPNHRIEAVERFVENQNSRLVRDRLREPDALSHALAVRRDFAIRGIHEIDAFDSKLAEVVCLLAIVTVDEKKRVDKLAARHT